MDEFSNFVANLFIWWVCIIAVGFMVLFASSVKVPVWYTWIKVNNYANGENVQPKWLRVGRNFVNKVTHDVFMYPTFIQQAEYEALNFQDKWGLVVTADIGMDYKFDKSMIGSVYEEYKAGVEKITNEYMRTWVKNAVNRSSSSFEVDALYGEQKEEFRLAILKNLRDDLGKKWIIVNNVYFTNEMKLPAEVKGRINMKIEATQKAMQTENELRTTQAEAQKVIAQAEGAASATILKAEAQAKANKLISDSITPTLIQYEQAKKWDGKMPQVTGWWTPIISLNPQDTDLYKGD